MRFRTPALCQRLNRLSQVVFGLSRSGRSRHGKPEISERRIGIDAAAYTTGILTCLVLEGTERTFTAAEH